MNKHIFLDRLTAFVGSWIAGNKKFFAKSIESPTLQEQIACIELSIPSIDTEGIFDVNAKTPAGKLDPAFCVAQWKGNDYPTIIFHHGNNERPFDFKKGAKNTFWQIFINTPEKLDVNLIVVRAPFHNCTLKEYQNSMVELGNFAAMIATSAKINEELIMQIRKISLKPIITSGISLGGWVTNLHRAVYNTSTAYAPLMAGTYLGELFLKSKYRKMVSGIAHHNPETIRKVLNFNRVFENKNTTNVFPLLARYDQFIEYDLQRKSYNGYPLNTIETGHITGAINSNVLRKHVIHVLQSFDKESNI